MLFCIFINVNVSSISKRSKGEISRWIQFMIINIKRIEILKGFESAYSSLWRICYRLVIFNWFISR